MARQHESFQHLTRGLRALGSQWLSHLPQPHEELLAMVWGPRFDRAHAMELAAHRPEQAARILPALLSAADRFDGLEANSQGRLRSLILRHRRLSTGRRPSGVHAW